MFRLYRYKETAEKQLVRELIAERDKLSEIEAFSVAYALRNGGKKPPGRYQIEHEPGTARRMRRAA